MGSDGELDFYCDYNDDSSEYNDEKSYLVDEDGYDDTIISPSCERCYHVLNESEIQQRQLDEISRVSDLLSLPLAKATRLLYHYKWSVSELQEEWFSDEGKVREIVGLPTIDDVTLSTCNKKKGILCGVCFDVLPIKDFYSLCCGHKYCKLCWKGYVTSAIMDGPRCLSLRCPEPSCEVAVCRDTVEEVASEEGKKKYLRFLFRSFVEVNKKIKWCPAPGCENAVELEIGDEIFDVTCLCKGVFCWNCGEDAHRPVNCETAGKWILKNKSDSENMTWILANSKACPKCKTPIEKNHGCMHMTCIPPCRHEFCWLCLGSWSDHGEKTGGFYACNKYDKAKQEGLYDEEASIREMAKNSIEKYTHYYERWASNQKSREKAMESLKNLQIHTLEELSSKINETEKQLKFISEAWEQVIECRRVLKWSYVYGYYVSDENKDLFEHSQGVAEDALERLHMCVEKELGVFFESDKRAARCTMHPRKRGSGEGSHHKGTWFNCYNTITFFNIG